MYTLLKTEGVARRGRFTTVHGDFETPAFMNVATSAAIKGGVMASELPDLGCQVMLSNTYHLHIRPGEDVIRDLGGLNGFSGWQGPTLTDSGGFQVFSLSGLRTINEQGVIFASHLDGRRIFMGPEESMRIQSALGSTIAMAFDECIENPATYDYTAASIDRTTRWAKRCITEIKRLNESGTAINPNQMLFGINQGSTYNELRIRHMQEIAALDMDGYAVGGLAVGESAEEMYSVLDALEPHVPKEKIRYLMGVGTPANLLEAVHRGVDLFDCVMPTRNARHGHLFTHSGILNIHNAKYQRDSTPIEEECGCPACTQGLSKAYLRHLIKAGEMLGQRLAVMHNLYFYNHFMSEMRSALDKNKFADFRRTMLPLVSRRI